MTVRVNFWRSTDPSKKGRNLDRSGVATRSRESVVALRAITTALGVLSIAIADFRARRGLEPSEPFLWLGLVIIVVPIGLALWSPRPTRRDRVGLVLLLGLGLQSAKVLYSPGNPVFFDEFSHLRTAIDIAVSGHVFQPNPLQPISAYYPGLEALTTVFAGLSGLSLTQAGVLVIGTGRIVLMLALFMLFERASRSHRIAGAAVLLYSANPSFLYFDAQVSYESLALPFAILAFALLAARTSWRGSTARGRGLLAGIVILSVVVIHHVTAFALAGFLIAWVIVGRLRRGAAGTSITPVAHAAFATVAAAAWLLVVSPKTVSYLAPDILGGVQQLIRLIAGESTGRRLFEDAAGGSAPLWERVVGYLAVILILAALPAALWTVRRDYGRMPIAIALAMVALIYPGSLALRLTPQGAETAGRLSEFIFLGIGFTIAVWGARLTSRSKSGLHAGLLAAATAIMFVGGGVIGFAPWARLPFPYRPAADPRSVEPEGLSAAAWTETELGSNHVFVTDRTNRQLLGSYGYQNPLFITAAADLLLSPAFDQAGIRLIASRRIEYVLTDRRLSLAVPLTVSYVIRGEMGGRAVTSPLDPAALTKFDTLPATSRVFDSGDIQIFDVKGLW
jgi:hypothetical protein